MKNMRKRLRILIADDHELVRHGIRAVLGAENGWVIIGEATDGLDAVVKAVQLRPDIAILDITMPMLDGLEAARRIRTDAPETKVLVLTMHESDQMVCRVMEAGARGYILKTDLPNQLVRAVKEVLAGRAYLTPKASELVARGIVEEAERSKRSGPELVTELVPLTPREIEVLGLLAAGRSNKEVAAVLGMTVRTAETHRAKIMLKLGLHSLVELVHYAARHGLAEIPGAKSRLEQDRKNSRSYFPG